METLKVDGDHLQMNRPEGSPAPIYAIHAAPSVELDATGYAFEIPTALRGLRPNSIQLVLGKDAKYSAHWVEGRARYVLSGDSLTPIAGSRSFTGFPSGATGIIAIGYLDGADFSVLWVGMFEVQ